MHCNAAMLVALPGKTSKGQQDPSPAMLQILASFAWNLGNWGEFLWDPGLLSPLGCCEVNSHETTLLGGETERNGSSHPEHLGHWQMALRWNCPDDCKLATRFNRRSGPPKTWRTLTRFFCSHLLQHLTAPNAGNPRVPKDLHLSKANTGYLCVEAGWESHHCNRSDHCSRGEARLFTCHCLAPHCDHSDDGTGCASLVQVERAHERPEPAFIYRSGGRN